MIGYKATDKNGECRGFKFEVGKTYTKDTPKNELECCTDKVFHFCRELFAIEKESNYKLSESRLFEVIAGDYVRNGDKYGTNSLTILREIEGEEKLSIINSGNCNSGNCNSGDWNSGYFNTDSPLTKAKEIIKDLLKLPFASNEEAYADVTSYLDRAEQFLKDSEVEKMTIVKRTERGWAGHFICSDSCKFRRNTLLECGDKAIVISTVGAMYDEKGKLQEIGIHRHYETMCFYVDETSGEYKDADVSREIFPEGKWALKWHKDGYIDNEANEMHESIVIEMTAKLLKGEL